MGPGGRRLFQRMLLRGEDVTAIVSSECAARWTNNFWEFSRPSLQCLGTHGRRINRFMVGSDPEFCFAHPQDFRVKMPASEMGMKPALAFGADQNLRLVELRPVPSRSVVYHVAGILTLLRLMVRYHWRAKDYLWRCGAFFDGDGMGGHVHFGRKRPSREQEVAGLDGLARTLRLAGFFPDKEWATRAKGDARHQVYGQYGDIRPQAHGYEYRTLPSWLQSPQLAFIVITASKLVILDPSIPACWAPKDVAEATRLLLGFAKYYSGLDDDALIMYDLFLTQDMTWKGGCFKDAWGIKDVPAGAALKPMPFLPAEIFPNTTEVQEIHDLLTKQQPLKFSIRPLKEFATALPPGFSWYYANFTPPSRAGIGDFAHDLVLHESCPMDLAIGTDNFTISEDFMQPHPLELRKEISARWRGYGLRISKDYTRLLAVPRTLLACGPDMREFKKFVLTSGIFPLWTVKTVTAESHKEWKTSKPESFSKGVSL